MSLLKKDLLKKSDVFDVKCSILLSARSFVSINSRENGSWWENLVGSGIFLILLYASVCLLMIQRMVLLASMRVKRVDIKTRRPRNVRSGLNKIQNLWKTRGRKKKNEWRVGGEECTGNGRTGSTYSRGEASQWIWIKMGWRKRWRYAREARKQEEGEITGKR